MRLASTFVVAALFAALMLTAGRIVNRPAVALAAPLQTVNCDVDPSQIAPGAAELDLLNQINQYRAANGAGPLAFDASLQLGAVWKANNIVQTGTFAHDDSFRSWTQRIADCGYPSDSLLVAENLAGGVETAASAVAQWQGSPIHNSNMLNPDFTAVGIKRVPSNDQYGWYWVLVFGTQVLNPMTTDVPAQ